jgi:hypothetical protein
VHQPFACSTGECFKTGAHFGGEIMLIPGVIGVVNPGPPRRRKSPLHEVRRMMSYVTKSPMKPMKPPVAAAPAAELVPAAIGTGIGTGAGARANALFGAPAVNTNAVAMAACANLFIGPSSRVWYWLWCEFPPCISTSKQKSTRPCMAGYL